METTAYHAQLCQTLQERLAQNTATTTVTAAGKSHVRVRLQQLLDPQRPFLELSALAGWEMYERFLPAGGVVCGIGCIANRLCMVVANDFSVKAGAYFPIGIKKHLRALQIALENRLACVYLVDSAGIYLPAQAQLFADQDHFGRLFYMQAKLSSHNIPQIAVVLGMCTAGGAYVPAMADISIMVDGQSTMFLAGPQLVRAATGEQVDAQALGGSHMHAQTSGVADYRVASEPEALQLCRQLVEQLGDDPTPRPLPVRPAQPPRYAADSLLGMLPLDSKSPLDMPALLLHLCDNSEFIPFKPEYGPTLCCGFAYLMGMRIGIIANHGIFLPQSAQKGAHFIQLCQQQQLPLLFIQNITGFMVGEAVERAGIIKSGAHMVQMVATTTLPKLTLMVGASNGAGNYAMCGRGFSPRMLFTWPQAKVAVMGAAQASFVMDSLQTRQGKAVTAEQRSALSAQYEAESSPYYATARLWDDGLIDPCQTRHILALALGACALDEHAMYRAPVFRF